MSKDCQFCIKATADDISSRKVIVLEKHINYLVSQCPEFHGNIEKIARIAFIDKLKCSTPGKIVHSRIRGLPFAVIFFPNHQEAKYSDDIEAVVPALNLGLNSVVLFFVSPCTIKLGIHVNS